MHLQEYWVMILFEYVTTINNNNNNIEYLGALKTISTIALQYSFIPLQYQLISHVLRIVNLCVAFIMFKMDREK